ncbi:MAG TPA: hypothetical protein VL988_07570 [Solirubrobacteraceae bacterium]|nr:hypothetical protein [Solirubrobacteraceae bacterium]
MSDRGPEIEREEVEPDVARRFADARAGWTLAAATNVALPYWRIRTRVRVLARKRIGAIDEYVLRTIRAGISNRADIGAFLGLGDQLMEATTVGLLEGELVAWRGNDLALTHSGTELLRECVLIKSEVRTVEIEWDGLLRRPVAPLSGSLEPRDIRALGIREIPPSPSTAPTAEEMRDQLGTIEELLRQLADRRAEMFDLLDIGGIERRFRMFRPATALVYEREGATDVQVSLVVDGRISDEHEQAFARAGLARRLGVGDKGLPSDRRAIDRLLKANEVTGTRALAPYEHSDPMQIALAHSERRLLIIGRELRTAVVGEQFLEAIEACLQRGVQVTLAWISKTRDPDGCDTVLLDSLRELADKHPGLTVGTVNSGPCALVSDDRIVVLTSYDYLGRRGGQARNLHDARGVLVTGAADADALVSALSGSIRPLREKQKRRRVAAES